MLEPEVLAAGVGFVLQVTTHSPCGQGLRASGWRKESIDDPDDKHFGMKPGATCNHLYNILIANDYLQRFLRVFTAQASGAFPEGLETHGQNCSVYKCATYCLTLIF